MRDLDVLALEDDLIDECLDVSELLRRDWLEVREVEAQAVRRDGRAGLVDLVADDLLEGSLQQMRRRVVARRGELLLLVDFNLDRLADLELAFLYVRDVVDRAVRQLLGVRRLDAAELAEQQTLVADLSAALCVERGLVEDDAGLFAVRDLVDELAVLPEGDDLGLFGLRVYLELRDVDAREVRHSDALVLGTGTARTLALLVHGLVKALFVEVEAVLVQDLFRELPREAERVVEAETNLTRQLFLAVSLEALDLRVEQLHALVERCGEAVFLDADDLLDVVVLGDELTEVAGIAVDLDDGVNGALEELALDAEHAAVADGAAQDAAQHVAAALVRRQDAVHDHDGHGARVISDDLQRDVRLLVLAVLDARDLGRVLDDRVEQIRLEVRLLVLHDGREALEAAARIDVLMGEILVGAVFLAVVLREDEVPDLEVAVAVAADSAGRRAAAALFTEVDVDLGVWTARTRADLPEVVLHLDDVVLREARLGLPDLDGLRVVRVDRDPELVLRQLDDFRQELPCPGNGLALEVIAEREVAEHLEERLMARRAADVLDITRADAALARRHARAGRLHLAREERLQRSHAGADQEERRVILRDQRETRQAQMAFLFRKELQISFAQFVTTHVLQKNLPP